MSSSHELRPFFEPAGIAVVGARRRPGFGYTIPLQLTAQGFGDRLYLVNPNGGELHGLPVYRRVGEVPDPVDLAIVIVPAAVAPAALDEIGARGIRCAIVESAGFAEIGEAGRVLQEEAKAAARKWGLRVMGPNCVGVVNTGNRFSSVEVIEEAMRPGSLAIVAQSGVFGNVLLDGLPERGLRISKAVTLGNRLDVDECEVLDCLHRDPATRTIMMYLEGAADGRRLVATLARVTRDKPVLVLKSGRTAAGRAATASHTGSLSGEDALYRAAFNQTGALRAESLEELVALARAFTSQPLPAGPRLGIVTSSGSLGALAADAAVASGLTLPPLSPALAALVREGSPEWMNVKNPLDVGPSPQYVKALSALMSDPGIDLCLAITIIPLAAYRYLKPLGLTAGLWFGDLPAIRKLAPEKPLLVAVVGNSNFVAEMTELAGPETPVLTSPELAAKALAALWQYRDWKTRG